MKQLSKAWHDRPESAMDSAVYWTEYAAKYKNISLKSAAVDVPFYKYAGLDVLSVLVGILLGVIVLFRSLGCNISSSNNLNTKKKRQ